MLAVVVLRQQRFEQRSNLVFALGIFELGARVRDDSTTCPANDFAPTAKQGANRDVAVEASIGAKVKNRSAVDAAAKSFQLVDDLHCPPFWCPRDGATRKAGKQQISGSLVVPQRATDSADQMMHV